MAASPRIVSNEAVARDFALWAEVIADSSLLSGMGG